MNKKKAACGGECAAKESLATPTVRALADMAARALSPVPR
jgi:hypothetical protein